MAENHIKKALPSVIFGSFLGLVIVLGSKIHYSSEDSKERLVEIISQAQEDEVINTLIDNTYSAANILRNVAAGNPVEFRSGIRRQPLTRAEVRDAVSQSFPLYGILRVDPALYGTSSYHERMTPALVVVSGTASLTAGQMPVQYRRDFAPEERRLRDSSRRQEGVVTFEMHGNEIFLSTLMSPTQCQRFMNQLNPAIWPPNEKMYYRVRVRSEGQPQVLLDFPSGTRLRRGVFFEEGLSACRPHEGGSREVGMHVTLMP